MNRGEQLQTAWFDAHQELRVFLSKWVTADEALPMASTACGWWIERAADGEQPSTGPYVALYASAVSVVNLQISMHGTIPLDVAAVHIPVNTSMLPYQLSKIHTDIWRAAQLLSWDRKTIRRVSKGITRVWPVSATSWGNMGLEPLGNLVPPLVRRAVDVLSEHECLGCKVCDETAVRWENADRRTEEWFVGARLRKETDACPTQERSPFE